jgi:hypothetical protein
LAAEVSLATARARLVEAEAAIGDVRAILDALDAPAPASAPELHLAPEPPPAAASSPAALAWGAKVSPIFRDRVRWIAENLDIGPAHGRPCADRLMTCKAWETGRSFRPDVKNMAGSGATGLIQFMPATARTLWTTVRALARMSAEDQLNYVWKYFKPYDGRLRSLADVYMAILWPAAVGKPDDATLFAGGIAYRQNAGLDVDRDGKVTKAEAAAKVAALLSEGLKPGNAA